MKIALLGDIAFFGKYSIENKSIFEYFRDASELLKNYDCVIGNLETPFCNTSKPFGYKSAHIKAEPENIEILKYLNVGIVNLSNNHILDYGIKGYEKTKKVLSDNGIEFFGIDNKQYRVEKNGQKIALSGFCCYSTNALGYYNHKTKKGVNVLNAFDIEKLLLKNSEEGYFNIVSIHAGQEHVNYPNYDHVEMARLFSDKVPYIYYGHHPHVLQGIEEENESLIAYSIGNFCFDDVYTDKSTKPLIEQTKENKSSMILSVEIEDNKIVKYNTIPIYLGDSKMEIQSNDEIQNKISDFSNYLSLPKEKYIMQRNIELNSFVEGRKNHRDFNWYIKRINYRSISLIINSILNKRKYKQAVKNYLEYYKSIEKH